MLRIIEDSVRNQVAALLKISSHLASLGILRPIVLRSISSREAYAPEKHAANE